MPARDAIDGEGINELDQCNKDLARGSLRQQVSDHNGARHMTKNDDLTRHKVAEKFSSTENVLGLLESHRIESHLDGGLRVAVEHARTVERDAKINQQLTNEHHLLGGEHGAKELCLGARERDGSLHLGEPMEEASVEKEHATGARKLCGPVRIDVALKVAVGVWLHDEGTVSCVAHVNEYPDGGFDGRTARRHRTPTGTLRRGASAYGVP